MSARGSCCARRLLLIAMCDVKNDAPGGVIVGHALLMRPESPLPARCSWSCRYAKARTSAPAIIAALCVGGVINASIDEAASSMIGKT